MGLSPQDLDDLHELEALSNSLGMDVLGPPPGELNGLMEAPPHAVYSSLEELIAQVNVFAGLRGYKLVVVRSKTNNVGQKIWVHLACDRHGQFMRELYRTTLSDL